METETASLVAREAALMIARGELSAAAELWLQHGQPATAARLFEQACAFGQAARAALAAGHDASLRLALLAGDPPLIEEVTRLLEQTRTHQQLCDIAASVRARGFAGHAARMFERVDAFERAAAAYQQNDELMGAVRCFERLNQPAPAARLLEAALRDDVGAEHPALRLTLGQLYGRHGKHRAAVRCLQQLSEGGAAWRGGLPQLATSLQALGLRDAAADIERKMAEVGVVAEASAEPKVADAAAGATLFGRYRVECEVASTPHARLLKARDTLSGRDVAVKLLVANTVGTGRDAFQRFLREAQALAQLHHPNVMPLLEMRPDAPAMVLPWMAGGDLRALIARGRLVPARAAEVATAVLSALAEAHRMGIVHRDVKPSNVLFDEGGSAYLADFGAAHLSTSEATVTVGEIGSYAYMSPEQRAGHAATPASDIFAVGMLLHEMICGVLPSSAANSSPLSSAHPDLDTQHDALWARLCALEVGERVASAQQASRLLASCDWSRRAVPRRTSDDDGERAAAELPDPAPATASAGRLQQVAGEDAAVKRDTLLDRLLVVLPLTARRRAWASAVARAGDPALPLIAKLDVEANQLWIVQPAGVRVNVLTNHDVERLRAALAAVHRLEQPYGALALAALRRIDGEVLMAYRPLPEHASVEADLAALAALPRA